MTENNAPIDSCFGNPRQAEFIQKKNKKQYTVFTPMMPQTDILKILKPKSPGNMVPSI
jgi:hypothetical protein